MILLFCFVFNSPLSLSNFTAFVFCFGFVFFSFSTLCLASSSHLQHRIAPRTQTRVYICQKSSERLTNANPLAGLKVLLSSGNDQMIPVHVTKSSSRRSDSCTKSYLTSKIPSAPGSCSLLMKIQLCEPDVRRSLEKLPSWCCLMWSGRLMIDDEPRGGSDVPESIK